MVGERAHLQLQLQLVFVRVCLGVLCKQVGSSSNAVRVLQLLLPLRVLPHELVVRLLADSRTLFRLVGLRDDVRLLLLHASDSVARVLRLSPQALLYQQ